MKVLVLFGVLLAYAQATSEPVISQQTLTETFKHCLEEKHMDEVKAKQYISGDAIPEDDDDVAEFLVCLWKKVSIIKDGSFDHNRFTAVLPQVIKTKYPNISESKVSKLVDDSVKECKSITEGGHKQSLTAVKYRNCLAKYIKDHHE